MTLLRPEDGPLHHSDGSHRGMCPDPRVPQEAWIERIQLHLAEHRTDLDAGYLVARSGATIGRRQIRRAKPSF